MIHLDGVVGGCGHVGGIVGAKGLGGVRGPAINVLVCIISSDQ